MSGTSKLQGQVIAFHQKFGHPIRTSPTIPSEKEVRFRMSLITEEFLELLGAIYGKEAVEYFAGPRGGALEPIADLLRDMIHDLPLNIDFPEAIDAMGDLDYVVEGTRVAFGTDGVPIADEIQRANMDKHPNGPDKKPTKPHDWQPPDIIGCLIRQGWRLPEKKEER